MSRFTMRALKLANQENVWIVGDEKLYTDLRKLRKDHRKVMTRLRAGGVFTTDSQYRIHRACARNG